MSSSSSWSWNWNEGSWASHGRAWQTNDWWQADTGGTGEFENRGRARTGPPQHKHHKFPPEQVLRCPWPGPRNVTFPVKGEEWDWDYTRDYCEDCGLVSSLAKFSNVTCHSCLKGNT